MKIKLLAIAILIVCVSVNVPAQTARSRRITVDTIIRGGIVVTMNAANEVIENGSVVIKGGRIVEVGSDAQIASRYSAREVIDAQGRAVIPGLINGHTHAPMSLFRGLADDLDLNEWLTKYIFPAEAKNVNEDFVRAGTRLALVEMLRGGTTTYCDMYYFEDAIADETARAGMRAVLGETVIDFPVPDNKTFPEALRYTETFAARWRNHKLITPAIAPHAPYTVSEEHLGQVRALADRLKIPIVIHVAETEKELNDIRSSKGASPVAYLARINFLRNDVIAAHVVFTDDNDLRLIKETGIGVVHNPQSNMKLASGVARVPQMLAAGIAVGLGTDGAASNNDLDMWEEADTAAKLHKVFSRDPRVLSAREAFAMLTINGARALHLERETGSLEAGKRADITIVALDAAHQTPRYEIFSHLVYATKASDVRTVLVEGRTLMRERVLLTLDERAILARARQLRVRISASLNATPTR